MPDSNPTSPNIDIILPTFNRASFLPDALDAIAAQTYKNFRIIIVDDGSTDHTPDIIHAFAEHSHHPLTYVQQINAGAYAARNHGLDLASAPYIAFYDSDDIWLPDHLERCAAVLNEYPDVDWVYASARTIDAQSGKVLAPSFFCEASTPRAFLKLRTRTRGNAKCIIDPKAPACAIQHGLYCALQNSLIRRSVFAQHRFNPSYRNGQDQLLAIRAVLHGFNLAYLDEIHTIYRVHAENSSAAASGISLDKRIAVSDAIIAGYEDLMRDEHLTGTQLRAIRIRLAKEYLWKRGYAVQWMSGRKREALQSFARGLKLWPWTIAGWKTYLWARLRLISRITPQMGAPS